jgi:hypothetical protein
MLKSKRDKALSQIADMVKNDYRGVEQKDVIMDLKRKRY